MAVSYTVCADLRNIKRETWCSWEGDRLTFTGTDGQHALLDRILEGYSLIDARIGQQLAQNKSKFRAEQQDLFKRILQDSPALHSADRVRSLCKEYLTLLKAEFEKVLLERIGLVERSIAAEVNQWVGSLLDDPRSFNPRELDTRLQSLSSDAAEKYPIVQMHVSVLRRMFDSYVYRDPVSQEARPVSADQAGVFQVFKTRIIERAAADFRLSLLLRDFLIHCVIADRRLSFYAEAAEKLLGAVQANDVSVVSTPTGSGKSTLMPLLLLASGLGYKRIAVTQPRRYDSRSSVSAGPIVELFLAGLRRKASNRRSPCCTAIRFRDFVWRGSLTTLLRLSSSSRTGCFERC